MLFGPMTSGFELKRSGFRLPLFRVKRRHRLYQLISTSGWYNPRLEVPNAFHLPFGSATSRLVQRGLDNVNFTFSLWFYHMIIAYL
jgi:hypothetical protein